MKIMFGFPLKGFRNSTSLRKSREGFISTCECTENNFLLEKNYDLHFQVDVSYQLWKEINHV